MTTLEEVARLAAVRAPFCVTVYAPVLDWASPMQPTQGAKAAQTEVEHRLVAAGARREVIEARQEQLMLARDSLRFTDLRGVRTVGVFVSERGTTIQLLSSVPQPFTWVSDRFVIAPLIEDAAHVSLPVYVLALSERSVRLIDATPRSPHELPIAGLPKDLRSTLRLDLTGDRDTLAHLSTSDDPKERLREYVRAIHDALEPVLRRDRPLLVLAAAEPLAGIARHMLDDELLAAAGIGGNYDDATPATLAERAAPIAEAVRRAAVEEHLSRFAGTPSRGLGLVELRAIIAACHAGAVDTLFVDVDRRQPVAAILRYPLEQAEAKRSVSGAR